MLSVSDGHIVIKNQLYNLLHPDTVLRTLNVSINICNPHNKAGLITSLFLQVEKMKE